MEWIILAVTDILFFAVKLLLCFKAGMAMTLAYMTYWGYTDRQRQKVKQE